MSTTIAALVPMRHNSERVKGKNYRTLGGKPLYHHVVENLLACPQITQVVIDTDSPTITEDAATHFPTGRGNVSFCESSWRAVNHPGEMWCSGSVWIGAHWRRSHFQEPALPGGWNSSSRRERR